ncbi:phosphatidylinositol-4,5-bisphosphate 3-kinase catalytic subunit delta isoform, putative [Entamoeba invadens IP1]|uniref:phosphatidylinositol 3-kinase n=1 Tax=Entamoeba invadens IP1 TaxID=370355 RepID=A0A0A1UEI9_ENTIV|nr:phosphatidylinositol-4,5-bisphosphate 3-kinase catalytic subunit delta isoform, putative [Entamoeba invadens IP1]ELP94903.1 phosphatidylinositol-4,5-bisphosphate 3-kinase catalytic subunit delta isoform, putative [Entamoeba invadens IP1]|eukprot:XP_004261674.1 phosphatidylinositol-4,5-bisphosphate 3-kinase catalytic subunit delta isoform, putative [Entamoeba invadens IP1]
MSRKLLRSSVAVKSTVSESVVHVVFKKDDHVYIYTFPATSTAFGIKNAIKSEMKLEGTYSIVIPSIPFKVVDAMEDTVIKEMGFYDTCVKFGLFPTFEMVNREIAESYESVAGLSKLMTKLSANYQTIGQNYVDVLRTDVEEIFVFRRSLARVRLISNSLEEKYDRKIHEENEYAYTLSEPNLPTSVNKLDIRVVGTDLNLTAVFKVTPDVKVQKFINAIYVEFMKKSPMKMSGYNTTSFVLKVMGYDEYIIPKKVDGKEWLLSDFDYIRRQGIRGESLQLELVPRDNLLKCMISEEDVKTMKYLDTFFASEYWEAFDEEKRCSQRQCTDQFSMVITSVENLVYLSKKKGNKSKKEKKEKEEEESTLIVKDENQEDEEVERVTDFLGYISAELFYGEISLCPAIYSPVFEIKNGLANPKWKATFVQLLATLPAESKVIYSVYKTDKVVNTVVTEVSEEDKCVGTVNTRVVNYLNDLISGAQQYTLWQSEPNPIAMCCNAVSSQEKLCVEYPILTNPVRMDTFITKKKEMETNMCSQNQQPMGVDEVNAFNKIVHADALAVFTKEELKCLWEQRYTILKSKPQALARLLNSVNYTQPSEVHEMHRLLARWPLLQPEEAIELLDFRYPDPQIRAFALRCIDTMTDDQLVMYLPQLVQALKFELHHHSALASFLLRRSLKNRRRIGHNFFWFLKAEIHDARVTARYGVLLEAFLVGCGNYKVELEKEVVFQSQLVVIANEVKDVANKDEQTELLKSSLGKLKYPDEMSLPLDSRFRIKKTVPNTGKVFSSKKKPLMLVLQNADPLGEAIVVIQKVGDDLRQDILTLQMIRLMNGIWKNNGLDLCMLPYLCIATGNEIGMLELVKNSETYGKIMAMDEKKLSVFRETAMTTWLKDQCSSPDSKVQFELAVENFTYSCAGYCVATYILGIGDRHSDNVMLTKEGKFFHIDFGHFLGNFKKKFGVKRERTPFKFTPHFANVMGGKGSPQFKKFEKVCIDAFITIRQHGPLFIYLFRLMLATGIPELQKVNDIEYMRNMFMFDKNDQEAGEEFRKLIYKCLDAWSQTFNDAVHDFVHYKKLPMFK